MKNFDHLKKYDYLDSIEGFYPADHGKQIPLWDRLRGLIPGILICATVALAAKSIAQHYTAPVMLLCLLLGMIFHFMSQEGPTRKGVQFTSQSLLRAGVGLIGARIMLSDFTALGGKTLALVILAIGVVIALGVVWARLLKLDREQGLLIGGATAICGASAALALSTVMPKSKTLEHNTLVAVVGVPLEIYFNRNVDKMYVSSASPGFLHIFDLKAGVGKPTLIKTLKTDQGSHHIAFTNDGKWAFAQNSFLNLPGMSSGTINVVDLEKEEVVATITTLADMGLNPNVIVLLPDNNNFAGH